MESHKSDHDEEEFTSMENSNLADRLRDISQDRLVEEVIALWDEINNMEIELAASRRQMRSIELEKYSQKDSGRPLIAEYEEKLRIANTKITQLEKKIENAKMRNSAFASDQNKLKKLELKNAKLLQNEEELLMLVLDMEMHIEKLIKTIEE
ncbi:MAG: hypothetical protein ACKVI6_00205 [Candidatus Poseidoniales archaeon]|jgi:hypothetical protein|tara:strand:+ start:927 stop:1382 length:456 start_codon:yes stop_codon:yes gene_type:complete